MNKQIPLDSKSNKIRNNGSPSFCSTQVMFACTIFMTIGPFLVLINKYIISGINFRFPILVTSLGIFSSAIIVHILAIFKCIHIRNEVKQLVTFKFLLNKIAPTAMLQSLTFYFGNKAYIYVSVSLLQMLKSFTPVMSMILLYYTNQMEITYRKCIAVALLCIGTSITTSGISQSDSAFGIFLAFGAQFTEALKLTLNQKLLQGFYIEKYQDNSKFQISNMGLIKQNVVKHKMKLSTFENLYYYAPTTCVFSFFIALPLEYNQFMENYQRNMDTIISFKYIFIAAAILGFFVNFGSMLVTKVTSGLYLKALGTFRNICLVIVSCFLFNDQISFQQIIGYSISLIGFTYYNIIMIKHK